MFVSKAKFALFLFLAPILFGCSSGGDDPAPPADLTGQFIDSAVSGIKYVTSGGMEGVTDTNGSFTYKSGETVEFYVGDILIGSVAGAPIVTPVSLVPGAIDETNQTVINIARLLQSLDDDQDPANGINISADAAMATAGQLLDFTSVTFDAAADALVQTIRNTAYGDMDGLVSSASAEQHLRGSLLSAFAGTYSGSWTGPGVGGGWVFVIDEEGNVTGCGSETGGSNAFTIAGTVDSSGQTVAEGSTSNGATFSGTVSLDGSVSGNWSDNFGLSGTYSGSRATGSVQNCPDEGTPSTPSPSGLGSVSISGTDTTVIGTTFTPTQVTMPSTGSVRWRTVVDGGGGLGVVTHALLINFDPTTGILIDFTYSRIIDTDEYYYQATCSAGECSGVSGSLATQTLIFTNVTVPELSSLGMATAPITLNGTLTAQ